MAAVSEPDAGGSRFSDCTEAGRSGGAAAGPGLFNAGYRARWFFRPATTTYLWLPVRLLRDGPLVKAVWDADWFGGFLDKSAVPAVATLVVALSPSLAPPDLLGP